MSKRCGFYLTFNNLIVSCLQNLRPRTTRHSDRSSVEPLHMSCDSEPRSARSRRNTSVVHRAVQPHPDRTDHTDAVSS